MKDVSDALKGWLTSRGFRFDVGSANGGLKSVNGSPSGATYHEYDVYSRARGAARDAYRIVVNRSTGAVWFSPNHYTDFYRL